MFVDIITLDKTLLATAKVAGSTPGLVVSGQVVHTHVRLSLSGIIRYQSRGGDALRLER